MSVVNELPPAVLKYLQELELALKQVPGVSPEEAISDAREFLLQDAQALARSGEPPNSSEHYRNIVAQYGAPGQIAHQYADHTHPFTPLRGYAPGWRICCTKCGRSAPLAAIGGIRIGARSVHKYTLGYCRDCKRLRFLRILKDLDQTNLTEQLGVTQTTEQLRTRMHRPVATIVFILVSVFLSTLSIFGLIFAIKWIMGG
jgi:hypothetical protein